MEKLQSSVAHNVPASAQPTVAPAAPVLLPHEPTYLQEQVVDEHGKPIPAFLLDRKTVFRKPSKLPRLSEVAAEYLEKRTLSSGKKNRDIKTARFRIDTFLELIGDHPVNTYNPSDLQAYLHQMQYWPGDNNIRDPNVSVADTLANNQDLHLKPLTRKTLEEGYLAVIKAAVRSGIVAGEYADPFAGVKLHFPSTAAEPKSAEPLGFATINSIFRHGVESGLMEDVMLPLLGHFTGRRIGLLVHLAGDDIRKKFDGVWVAQTAGITMINGTWTRVPYKTGASTKYFVLHDFLHEIGFIDWAISRKHEFLFPNLMKLQEPSKSASSYMQRLFEKSGVEGKGEVFHSLRGGNIEDMRDAKVDTRDRKMQTGHEIGADEHENYGFVNITERRARELSRLPLNPEIDFSIFRGLDFAKIAKKRRKSGRSKATKS